MAGSPFHGLDLVTEGYSLESVSLSVKAGRGCPRNKGPWLMYDQERSTPCIQSVVSGVWPRVWQDERDRSN